MKYQIYKEYDITENKFRYWLYEYNTKGSGIPIVLGYENTELKAKRQLDKYIEKSKESGVVYEVIIKKQN